MSDVFRDLQKQLDQYSVGFPATKSGVEIEILKHLFSPSQAEMFLDLSLLPEDASSVASRTGRDPAQTAEMLADMAAKGLIFRLRKNDKVFYAASAFVVGIYEFQLKTMDEKFAAMVERYFDEGFSLTDTVTIPMRTIPVNQSLDVSFPVASHDDAREILKSQKKLAVAQCICRKQQDLVGHTCDKPREVCMVFGSHADYFVENGLARFIDLEEGLKILDTAEKGGLVNQPFNVINPGGMCNCCGCCCGVLRTLNRLPKPAEMVLTNHYAKVDPDACTGCETCLSRCQIAAITMKEDLAHVNRDRCIGCGLCVTTCPTGAITLNLVDADALRTPPAGVRDLMMQIAAERGTSVMPLKMQGK